MSKRNKGKQDEFPKIPKDKYYTWDKRPGIALRSFIPANARYYELSYDEADSKIAGW